MATASGHAWGWTLTDAGSRVRALHKKAGIAIEMMEEGEAICCEGVSLVLHSTNDEDDVTTMGVTCLLGVEGEELEREDLPASMASTFFLDEEGATMPSLTKTRVYKAFIEMDDATSLRWGKEATSHLWLRKKKGGLFEVETGSREHRKVNEYYAPDGVSHDAIDTRETLVRKSFTGRVIFTLTKEQSAKVLMALDFMANTLPIMTGYGAKEEEGAPEKRRRT